MLNFSLEEKVPNSYKDGCCIAHLPPPPPPILTLLLLSSLITDSRPKLKFRPIRQDAVSGTHHHTKAGFLEDLAIVVVGVAHGPTAKMSLCIFIFNGIDISQIPIRPLLERIKVFGLLHRRQIHERKEGGKGNRCRIYLYTTKTHVSIIFNRKEQCIIRQ